MKVNLQKIISLIAVSAIVISALNISAFATSEPSSMTNQEYYAAQFDLIDKFCDGDITYIQFQEQSQAVTDEYITANTVGGVLQSGALNASNNIAALSLKIGATVDKWGDNAREHVSDWWNDICNKNNVPTDTVQNPTTNLGGYGAAFRYGNDCYVCDYVIVDNSNPTGSYKIQIGKFNNDYLPVTRYYLQGGKWVRDLSGYGNGYLSGFRIVDGQIISSDNKVVELYGDVRYINGEQYPTDDEWEYGTLKKFDDMPEKDLEDLLNDFAEEIERQNPDLSSIEGLLNAIYARLGTLDSDDDNQLLSEVLAAIKAIKSTDTDNTELLELLEDIKNSLVFNDGENTETFSEQLKKIIDNQITLDDFVIDEDLYNNHGEILKERLLGKFSFIYNMKTFVVYCFDKYSNTSETPEVKIEYNGKSYSINFSFFNEYLPTIQWILAAFAYLTYAYHTYRKIPSYINGGDNE